MTAPYVPQRAELKWAAVDFDGTLCRSAWSPENPTSTPGDPIPENIGELLRLVDAGFKVVIHTSRPWADFEIVESWLNHYSVPFRSIVCGKLLAAVYIDDRAVHASADWLSAARKVVAK